MPRRWRRKRGHDVASKAIKGRSMSSKDVMQAAGALAMEAEKLAVAVGFACFDLKAIPDVVRLGATMIARAQQSLASTDQLAQRGLVADAMSCSRTIVELAIDLAYIRKDHARITRFINYGPVHRYRLASQIAAHGGTVPADVLSALKDWNDRFRADNSGSPLNWSGHGLDVRAAECGRTMLYRLAYADQCAASHSGPITLEYVHVGDERGLGVHFGAQSPSAHPITLAVMGLGLLIGDVVQEAQLVETFGVKVLTLMQMNGVVVALDRAAQPASSTAPPEPTSDR